MNAVKTQIVQAVDAIAAPAVAAKDVDVHSSESRIALCNEVTAIDRAIMKIGVSHPNDDWTRVARDMVAMFGKIGVSDPCGPIEANLFKSYFFGICANYSRDLGHCIPLMDAIRELNVLFKTSSAKAVESAFSMLADDVLGIARRQASRASYPASDRVMDACDLASISNLKPA